MSCIFTTGYSLGCKDNLGGVQKFYTFEQRNEVGEYKEDGAHSVENGTNYWTQIASLTLYKNQASVRDLLLVLSQSRLQVLVLDQNGKYFMMAEQNGADLTASSIGLGKAYGDLN